MDEYVEALSEHQFAIFLFHGVIAEHIHPVRNYTRKHLDVGYFEKVLTALIGAGGMPVSMNRILDAHRSETALPPKSFAVTFDDGFLNNLTIALPVLESLQIPATVYITSDFVQSNRMSWIDRIEWAVEPSGPVTLSVPWGAVSFHDTASKCAALDSIRFHAKQDAGLDLDAFATDLQRQLGRAETWSSDDPLDQKLTWDQVKDLDASPLIEIGGHSHTHGILSFLSSEALAVELDVSLSYLAKLGIWPKHYSYPEGMAHCYSQAVIDALTVRGVEICPTAMPGVNRIETDPFHLKRITVI